MMTLDRAREIVKAINARCFVHMGLEHDLPSLEGVSLADMVEATAMIRNVNKVNQAAAKFSGGQYSVTMVPDDRLIAAVYAIDHYPMSNEPVLALPRPGGKRLCALAVVNIPVPAEEEEDA